MSRSHTYVSEQVTAPEQVATSEQVTVSERVARSEQATAPEQTTAPEQATAPEQTTASREVAAPEQATASERVTAPEQATASERVTEAACPLVEVLDHVAGKWSISILVAAAGGPVRFTELERSIEGISRRMLTLNLRRLERDGLLTRTVHPTVPPKVEYGLTPMAEELYSSLTGLVAWAERHRGAIARARNDYDTTAAAATPAA